MVKVGIDPDDGMLIAIGIPFDLRSDIDELGGVWCPDKRAWKFTFTTGILRDFMARIPDVHYEPSFREAVRRQSAVENALEKIREMGLHDDPVKFDVPGLKLPPYNYQKLGIMYAATNGRGVLIGDQMGLGKTIQGIGTALWMKHSKGIRRTLIVTPASLKWNWPLEIEKFTNEKYVVIDGTPAQRMAQWADKEAFFFIVNYELLVDLFGKPLKRVKGDNKEDPAALAAKRAKRLEQHMKLKQRQAALDAIRSRVWDLVICDEIHQIKHPTSLRSKNVRQIRAKMRMGLTGTPLDGRLEELHAIMQFIQPGLLCNRAKFFQRYVICDLWGKPTGYKRINEVKAKIAPFFIRRLKENVLKSLPPKVYLNKLIELTAEEKKAYREIADGGKDGDDGNALTAVIRCKQFCDYPALVDPGVTHASKCEIFLEMLGEVLENGHKAIVFSQYTTILDVLEGKIKDMGVKFIRIDGNTPAKLRADYQAEFNTDPTIDLILASEAGSTGLNLQAADYVFNYDDNWSPAYMNQREDRAHRNGQVNSVTVVNFICKETIEETIRGVIYSKNRVSNEVLGDNTDEMVMKRLGIQEIAKLL